MHQVAESQSKQAELSIQLKDTQRELQELHQKYVEKREVVVPSIETDIYKKFRRCICSSFALWSVQERQTDRHTERLRNYGALHLFIFLVFCIATYLKDGMLRLPSASRSVTKFVISISKSNLYKKKLHPCDIQYV